MDDIDANTAILFTLTDFIELQVKLARLRQVSFYT